MYYCLHDTYDLNDSKENLFLIRMRKSFPINFACADCGCSPECRNRFKISCKICIRQVCCCESMHKKYSKILFFSSYTKSLFPAAIGIEILCITAAETGLNIGLYLFGYHAVGIALSYVTGYSLAALTTFIAILGRTRYGHNIDSCCSVLEQQANNGFTSNLILTFRNFASGLSKLSNLSSQPDLKNILKASIIILTTAESACILTAETIDLIFYKQSFLLASILGLFVGSFTLVGIEAYKKIRSNDINQKSKSRNGTFWQV
jgi:hypothetical protein